MVTNLNLQQVSHHEQRNVWIGPTSMDLVHLGAKFAGCMRRDSKILDVIAKTKRKERETACCIRNDDSGCVQTSQAECSVGGLWPTQKTISTWKKWSPGDSGTLFVCVPEEENFLHIIAVRERPQITYFLGGGSSKNTTVINKQRNSTNFGRK